MGAADDALDVRDPARTSTYLVGHVAVFPPPTSAVTLASVVAGSAAERVQAGTPAGVRNVTVIFGADTVDFDRLEATALAIFTSARFD